MTHQATILSFMRRNIEDPPAVLPLVLFATQGGRILTKRLLEHKDDTFIVSYG